MDVEKSEIMLKETMTTLELALQQLRDINYSLDEACVVAVTDVKGNIIFVNQKFCDISQYARNELLGQNHRIINSGYHSQSFWKNMWHTIANGKIWRGEIRNQAKDGSYYWMDTTIVPLLNAEGKPYRYVSFRVDITERKQAEEFLRRSEKITVLGQMASAIAHEIRNPLAAIKMTVELMRYNDANPEDDNQFDMILSELSRVDSIVGEFLVLARPHEENFTDHDIHDLLEVVVSLMSIQAARNNVKIALEPTHGKPVIRCDEQQLKQVFINVIKNAIEAMQNGGTITVQVEIAQNNGVILRFIDQGSGIPEEVLDKLGEPFFTTKETGTGLGLMICQKIVQEHQGTFQIHSQAQQGTTVEIFLPARRQETTA